MGMNGLGRALDLPPAGDSGGTYTYELSEGLDGVKETIALMVGLTKRYRKDAFIISTARMQLLAIPAHSKRAELRALFGFVRRAIRYTPDVRDVEMIVTPDRLLREVKAGDCDDMALLLAALAESIGFRTRFVACGFEPQSLTHVFVQAKVGNEWISMDATEPHEMGWSPPGVHETSCYVAHV